MGIRTFVNESGPRLLNRFPKLTLLALDLATAVAYAAVEVIEVVGDVAPSLGASYDTTDKLDKAEEHASDIHERFLDLRDGFVATGDIGKAFEVMDAMEDARYMSRYYSTASKLQDGIGRSEDFWPEEDTQVGATKVTPPTLYSVPKYS